MERMQIPKEADSKPLLSAPTTFAFKQAIDGSNKYQLFIYDEITKYGKWNWETWSYEDSDTSANKFRKILQEIPEGGELEIHINSNGGEAFEAVTIYNLLRQFKGKKTSIVDGAAHSAAFIIPFACDYRVMGKGTAALFHNMWTCARGNATQLRMAADRLDQLMKSNRQIYLERAKNITEEEMIDLMEKETMLTPEMCLEYGFCDEVAGYVSDSDRQLSDMQKRTEQIRQMTKMNEAFQKELLMLAEPQKPEVAPMQQQKENNNTKKMALDFMSAFLMATAKKTEV